MQVLTVEQVEVVSGGMDAYTGAGFILGLAGFAATPVVLGVAFGAAGGLIVAKYLASM